jgi:hypothetical protein
MTLIPHSFPESFISDNGGFFTAVVFLHDNLARLQNSIISSGGFFGSTLKTHPLGAFQVAAEDMRECFRAQSDASQLRLVRALL